MANHADMMDLKNMTTGVVWKKIFTFSLPIMLGNVLQQLYGTVDGIVVGNYVGEDALAAVGSCVALSFLFLSAALGLSGGAGIMVSQFYGAKRMEDVKKGVTTSLILLVSLGFVFSIAGFFLARPLLGGFLRVEEGPLREQAVTYFSIFSLGLVFQFTYNTIASILRAIGDSKATLLFLCVSAVLNLLLDLLFVIVFDWGVAGAAVATVIAQAACTAVSIIYMRRKYEMFRFGIKDFVFDVDKCKICLRLGIPTTIQQCVIAVGNITLQRLVNSFGQATMAAFDVGNRMDSYVLVTIFGFNMGLTNFTGQNMGAGKPERIKSGFRSTIIMSGIVTVTLCILLYTFAGTLAGLFGIGGQAMEQAVEFMRFMSHFYIIFTVYGASNSVLQGSGDVMFATLCSFVSLLVRVCLAYALVYLFGVGYSACWWPIPMGWAVAITMSLIRYFSGAWKVKSITAPEPQEDTI